MVATMLNFAEFARQTSLSVARDRRNCRTICRKVPMLVRPLSALFNALIGGIMKGDPYERDPFSGDSFGGAYRCGK